MGSSAGQILSVAAPLALTFIAPGLGTAVGASLSSAAGLGLGAAGTAALGGAVVGAGVGGLTSAITGKNALTGAAIGGVTGGIGGYVQGSGGLSNALGLSTPDITAGVGAAGNLSELGTAAANNGMLTSGFSNAVSSAASPSSWSSYVPSILGGTGANPGIGSVLGAGANVFSGIQGTAAAKANAAAMQEANNNALALQAKNYNATTANLSPYLTTGTQANQRLSDNLGISGNTSASGYGSLTAPFTAHDLENTPGYQFQLQQGTKALNQSLGAQGQLFSGAALKEGQQFATGLADSTYNTAYAQYLANNQQNYNMLAGTSGSGQNAATNQGGFAAGLSNLGTSTLQNTGNITAAGNNASNTAINNSLAGILSGTVSTGGGASSYGDTGLPAGSYIGANGWKYNAQGQRIA